MNDPSSRPLAYRAWLRPFRNASILGLGRGAQGLLSLLYIVLATRALGPAQFGMLTIIHSTVLVAAQVVRFQSWQAVMRFGAPALASSDDLRFCRVLNFALLLDVASAMLAAGVLWAAMPTLAAFVNLPLELVSAARWYGLSVAFIVLGAAPLGVLRLLDRHDIVAWQTVVEPLVRLITALLCFASGAELEYFLVGWALGTVLGKAMLFAGAAFALARRGVRIPPRVLGPRWWAPERGIWRFSFGTNLSSTLNLSDVQIGPLLVGGLLGASEAGLYRVAQQVANVISKPVSKLLAPAIYTDFSALAGDSGQRERRQLVMRAGGLAGALAAAIFAVLALGGEPILGLLFGDAFRDAYPVMLWLAASGVVTALTFPLAPLLITGGHVYAVVAVRLLALASYVAVFHVATPGHGLIGGGMAVVTHGLVMAVFLVYASRALLHWPNRSEHENSAADRPD